MIIKQVESEDPESSCFNLLTSHLAASSSENYKKNIISYFNNKGEKIIKIGNNVRLTQQYKDGLKIVAFMEKIKPENNDFSAGLHVNEADNRVKIILNSNANKYKSNVEQLLPENGSGFIHLADTSSFFFSKKPDGTATITGLGPFFQTFAKKFQDDQSFFLNYLKKLHNIKYSDIKKFENQSGGAICDATNPCTQKKLNTTNFFCYILV